MQSLLDRSLRDILEGLARYRPFIGAVIAIILVVTLLPGDPPESEQLTGFQSGTPSAPTGSGNVSGSGVSDGGGATDVAGGSGPTAEGVGTAVAAGGAEGPSEGANTVAPAASGGEDPLQAPDCDPDTGRLRVPSVHAPPCVGIWPQGADNGGETAKGVTREEIIVADRVCDTPTGRAVDAAIGNDDTDEQVDETNRGYIDFFNAHYRTYGREVVYVPFECSGDEEENEKADAIHVAEKIGAFAVNGGPAVFLKELAARGVACVSWACFSSAAIDVYIENKPFLYGWFISNTQAYKHRAEFLGKQLCGRNAEWAGDPLYQTQRRVFGHVSFDDDENSYRSGAEFGYNEFASYDGADGQGCEPAVLIFQALDPANAQEDGRTIIGKLKDEGVTTVIYAGDPISIIFYSKEATNQQYFPEWMITGSVLTDRTQFGRLYDQQQWSSAFGLSWNPARVAKAEMTAWQLYEWHHGSTPPADDFFFLIYWDYLMMFTGIHLAGPNLNPQTFQQGLFSYPPSPEAASGITNLTISFGDHGLWQWEDFTAQDDATLIWWDNDATGEDETGAPGVGMYRYVEGGRRYMPGQYPDSKIPMFDEEGTILVYDERPEQDRAPEYEHQHYQE